MAEDSRMEERRVEDSPLEETREGNVGELNNIENGINVIDRPGNQYIIKNPKYIDYQYEFEKLAEDEILVYSYGEYVINDEEVGCKISAKNKNTNQERILGYWDTAWGNFQISRDKKSGIFFLSIRAINRPLFYVDGNVGKIWYMMDIISSATTTYDLKYLLYYVYESTDAPQRFILINLQDIEVVRVINWETEIHGGGLFSIFRSLDPGYDFRIDYTFDASLYATAYYNIENDIFTVVFDAKLLYANSKEREKITFEELGW
jgi:hypothetical protein